MSTGTGAGVGHKDKDTLSKDVTSNTSSNAHIKSTLAPTFFARSRRSSSRHRDSFNREKPVLVAPRTAQQQQPKVSSLFRRNTSVSSGSGSSAAALPQSSASAVADSDSYEDDESDFTDETDNDDDMEADEGARGVARELSGSGSVSREPETFGYVNLDCAGFFAVQNVRQFPRSVVRDEAAWGCW